MINENILQKQTHNWQNAKPFPHIIVDDFLDKDLAKKLEKEFPDFEEKIWHEYGNPLEVKKVCNNWNSFPKLTYQLFLYLNSQSFVNKLSTFLFNKKILYSDPGLNGGGWHIHKKGGKLNTHLDYSLHPKLNLQRKLNIIIYLNTNWKSEWGGNLGFWGNENATKPGKLIKKIEPKFNRAAIFDTTCNSWHGLTEPLTCPETEFRKSLAVYYLISPPPNVDKRGKVLFAPTEDQKNDKFILDLIKKRSNIETAKNVYSSKNK